MARCMAWAIISKYMCINVCIYSYKNMYLCIYTYRFQDGFHHEGAYASNKTNGKGQSVYPPEGSLYEGEYANGRYQGNGILKTIVNSIYKGEFLLGRRHGKGKKKVYSMHNNILN